MDRQTALMTQSGLATVAHTRVASKTAGWSVGSGRDAVSCICNALSPSTTSALDTRGNMDFTRIEPWALAHERAVSGVAHTCTPAWFGSHNLCKVVNRASGFVYRGGGVFWTRPTHPTLDPPTRVLTHPDPPPLL